MEKNSEHAVHSSVQNKIQMAFILQKEWDQQMKRQKSFLTHIHFQTLLKKSNQPKALVTGQRQAVTELWDNNMRRNTFFLKIKGHYQMQIELV